MFWSALTRLGLGKSDQLVAFGSNNFVQKEETND